jgi:hypothetical protein
MGQVGASANSYDTIIYSTKSLVHRNSGYGAFAGVDKALCCTHPSPRFS